MNIEEIGEISDKCDNHYHASKLPLPSHIHVEALSEAMKNIRDRLRAVYVQETGDNPWREMP